MTAPPAQQLACEQRDHGDLDRGDRAEPLSEPLRRRRQQSHAQHGQGGDCADPGAGQVQVRGDGPLQGRDSGDGRPQLRRDGDQRQGHEPQRWQLYLVAGREVGRGHRVVSRRRSARSRVLSLSKRASSRTAQSCQWGR